MKKVTRIRAIISIAMILCALLSSTVLSRYLSSTSFHKNRIAYLDDKKVLVTGLSATATSLSALISMIPDDTGTPIANEIADVATDFMIALAALTTEKYLLTISNYIVFAWIFPFVFLVMAINLLTFNLTIVWKLGIKTVLVSIVLVITVPASIKLSQVIDRTYHDSFSSTLEAAQELEEELNLQKEEEPEISAEDETAAVLPTEATEEKKNIFRGAIDAAGNLMGNAANTITDGAEKLSEKASQIASGARGIIKSIPDLPYKVSRIMNKMIEAFIVLIVTSCVIPILTMLFLMWYMTSILGAHIDYSFVGKMHRGKRKGMIDKSGTEVSTDNE